MRAPARKKILPKPIATKTARPSRAKTKAPTVEPTRAGDISYFETRQRKYKELHSIGAGMGSKGLAISDLEVSKLCADIFDEYVFRGSHSDAVLHARETARVAVEGMTPDLKATKNDRA